MIIIDTAEPQSVFDAFDRCGIDFETARLDVGDFTNDKGTFIAERKSFHDFWASMCDRRIYSQTAEMYELYESNRYVFVEVGSLADLAEEHKESVNWIYSLFGEIENWDCKPREYLDLEDLARKLDALDKKLGTERKKRDRKVKLYDTPIIVRCLMCFDGIGKKKAENMLEICGSFYGIIEDLFETQEKLNSIKGIKRDGKILRNMKKEIFKTHMKDSERFLDDI